jgi:putative transposase
VWSTKLLEQLNEKVKRRSRVVGIFPNDASTTRLMNAVLLEHGEYLQLESRRMFLSACTAPIRSLNALPALDNSSQ